MTEFSGSFSGRVRVLTTISLADISGQLRPTQNTLGSGLGWSKPSSDYLHRRDHSNAGAFSALRFHTYCPEVLSGRTATIEACDITQPSRSTAAPHSSALCASTASARWILATRMAIVAPKRRRQ
jgi:hypothetical protein